MRRTYALCAIGIVAAFAAITAVSQGYEPLKTRDVKSVDVSYVLSDLETTANPPCGCPKTSAPACCCKTDTPACHPGKGASSPACCPQPVATGFQVPATPCGPDCCPVNTTATAPGCCCNPKAPKAAPCCCNPKAQVMKANTVIRDAQGRIFLNGAVVIGGAKPPSLEDLLEKLDALKAKQAALDEEVKATRALVDLKFKAVVEKVNKLGASNPTTVIGEQHPDYRRYVVPPAKHEVSVPPGCVTSPIEPTPKPDVQQFKGAGGKLKLVPRKPTADSESDSSNEARW